MPKVDILIKTDGTEATSDELQNSNPNAQSAVVAGTTGSNRSIVTKSIVAHQLVNAGIGALKSTFNFMKSNYGNFTGDYLGQQKIDAIFSTASEVVSFGANIGFGFMAGGIPGAVAGLVVGTVNQGINYAQASTNEKLQVSRANAQANYNAQRIGTILTNGNR